LGLDDLAVRPDAGVRADAAPPDAGVCTSNADCFNPERDELPAFCIGAAPDGGATPRRCVRVERELCGGDIAPNRDVLTKDNVMLAVALVPFADGAPASQPIALAYKMAVDEIHASGGIRMDPPRELAIMFCDSAPSLNERVVKHVMRDLRVPAVLANFEGGDLSRSIDEAVATKTFVMNPNPPDETTKFRNSDRLVWNLLGTAEDVALAYAAVVQRGEALGRLVLPFKVAVVRTEAALEKSIADVVKNGPLLRTDGVTRDATRALRFNGDASVSVNAGSGRFQEIVVAQGTSGAFDVGGAVAALGAARPDVILLLTTNERDVSAEIIRRYEAIAEPRWILGPRNALAPIPYLQARLPEAGVDFEKIRDRFVGIQYAGATSPAERDAWIDRIRTTPAYAPSLDRMQALENFYDAIYWLAYGLAAAGPGSPITGPALSDGVRRLTSGPEVRPGPPGVVQSAFRQIGFGKTRYVGALGPPDIDEAFGTWNSVGATYCYAESGSNVGVRYDQARYTYTNGTTSLGATTCGFNGL